MKHPRLPEGYKLYVTHFRKFPSDPAYWTRHDRWGERPEAKEGATEARIIDHSGSCVAEGWADCSIKDNFSKKIGRNIAVGRALKAFETERFK